MGIVIRQSFWGSALMYTGVAIGYINTLILMPAYFDMDEIGLIRLIQSNATMLIPLATIGMGGSLVKYYPKLRTDPEQKNRVISIQLLVIALMNILIALALMIGSDIVFTFFERKSARYNEYIHISILLLLFLSFFEFLFSISRSELNIAFPTFLKEVALRVMNVIFVILYGFEIIDFQTVIQLLMGSYFLITLFFFIYLRVKGALHFSFKISNRDSTWLSPILKFAIFTLTMSIATSIINNIGFLLTSSYLGLEANGIFTICAFIGIIIEMPKRATSQILGPLLSKAYQDRNFDEIEKIYQKASINLGIISILLAIGIFTNLEDLFAIVPKGDILSQGSFVVIAIGLSKVISMFFGPSGEILIYSQHKNLMLFFLCFSATTMALLNIVLIPFFGLSGAAIAALSTVLIDQLIRFIVIQRKLQIKLFRRNHIKLILYSLIIAATSYFIPIDLSPVLSIMIRSLFIGITFLGGTYLLNLSEEFVNTANLLLTRISPKSK